MADSHAETENRTRKCRRMPQWFVKSFGLWISARPFLAQSQHAVSIRVVLTAKRNLRAEHLDREDVRRTSLYKFNSLTKNQRSSLAPSAVPFKAKILHKVLLLTSKGSGKRPGLCRCRVNQKRTWWAKTWRKRGENEMQKWKHPTENTTGNISFVASSNPLCLEIREEIIGDRWDNLQNFKKKRNPGTERMPCAACLKLACFGTRKIWGQNSPYHFAQQICFRFGAKMCEFSLHCVLIHDDSWIPAFELRKCIETYRDYI